MRREYNVPVVLMPLIYIINATATDEVRFLPIVQR